MPKTLEEFKGILREICIKKVGVDPGTFTRKIEAFNKTLYF